MSYLLNPIYLSINNCLTLARISDRIEHKPTRQAVTNQIPISKPTNTKHTQNIY